jgi:hypothetical protein
MAEKSTNSSAASSPALAQDQWRGESKKYTACADYSWEEMPPKVGQPGGLLVLKKPFG